MQDFITYARRHGIELSKEGPCQFCGTKVRGGVFECHENVLHLSNLLDFNNPTYYETRFLSVDAMALQHCELHGPWNNHIHLTRLYLIFENQIVWSYSKTPQLSIVINDYKRTKSESLAPPPLQLRGNTTTSDLLEATSADEIVIKVRHWARDVFEAFSNHHSLVSDIAKSYLDRYYR